MTDLGALDIPPPPSVEIWKLTKRFGAFTALDNVSFNISPGSFHALLGENGAGKSTLVKCLMGTYHADDGSIVIDGKEVAIASPRDAQRIGLGMVYQHFTLVPSMTVAENLVLGEPDLPHVVNWAEAKSSLAAFMAEMPFKLDLDKLVSSLSAGEKQKLEILKQLRLGSRLLILDEPTSVLTPDEADQILGLMRQLTDEGRISVVLISHKLREVEAYADKVTVLRQGKLAGEGAVADLTREDMVRMMVGDEPPKPVSAREKSGDNAVVLSVQGLCVENDKGLPAVKSLNLDVRAGEIVGIAGISGNGQTEFVQALAGQRLLAGGRLEVAGEPYNRTRAEMRTHRIKLLPEAPLQNACVRGMTVAENLALRRFDETPMSRSGIWINRSAMRARALELIAQFRVKTQGPDALIETLSGGNVQRTVLARELADGARLLIVQNPCFGLDLKAVAEIRKRIVDARNNGCAVLLLSEDLDEILELSDRILVMSGGAIVYETPREAATVQDIGHYMAQQEA